MSTTIKFGTDGWRAIIAQEYTLENLARVAQASVLWLEAQNGLPQSIVIGHDTRFGGKLFAETTARIVASNGIKVFIAEKFVSTPMVSLGVVKCNAGLGIVITASHNPPEYNGFKLKSYLGGPMVQNQINEVEALIPQAHRLPDESFEHFMSIGLIENIDLEKMYLDHAIASFDLDAMKKLSTHLAYDAMYGAGQNAVRSLFPDAYLLHCDDNPGFHGQAPEPIHRNLLELSNVIKSDASLTFGLANDGDADRIGMYDEDGNFVDSHHLLLLLLWYLHAFKGMTGKVVITFSVTDKMKKLAEHFGLDFEVTKIGFKYIAEIMSHSDVLVGGEESGGLAVKGHIPERDGVWIGLLIMEFMAKTGKSLKALIQELYAIVGSFAFDRYDLHLDNDLKERIISNCKNGLYKQLGQYPLLRMEDLDGYKFYIDDNSWVMIRPSGTEPLLRVYAQAENHEKVIQILEATKNALLN